METKLTRITDVKRISFMIMVLYRELWGDLPLEYVQEIYKVDGLDLTQKPV